MVADPRMSGPDDLIPGQFVHYLLVFIAAFGFYLYTLAPSLNWADGARMQIDAVMGGSTYTYMDEVAHITTDGLPFDRLGVAAWDHPLYVMIGYPFAKLPIGTPLFRINLLSALFGALAISVLYYLGTLLVINHWAALVGAGALAVSHTYWFHSVTAEVYTLGIFLTVCLITLAVRWSTKSNFVDLILFALVSGLGLANHRLFALVILPAAIFMMLASIYQDGLTSTRKRIELRVSSKMVIKAIFSGRGMLILGAFLIGFMPWLIQFFRMAKLIGVNLTVKLALTSSLIIKRLAVDSWLALIRNLSLYLGWLLFQFTPIGFCIGFYGFWRMKGKKTLLFAFFLATMALHIAFSANFSMLDQFNFHLPSYLVFSIGIMWGVEGILQKLDHRYRKKTVPLAAAKTLLVASLLLLPILLYDFTPPALSRLGVTESSVGIYPVGTGARDTVKYFLNPTKRGEDSAYRFASSTMEQLAPHALVFTPKTSEQEAYVVLRYMQLAEGLRPDVHLDMMLFDAIDQMPEAVYSKVQCEIGLRPLYLASLNPLSFPIDELQKEFEIIPQANLFRVLPKVDSAPATDCGDHDTQIASLTLDELIRRALRWE